MLRRLRTAWQDLFSLLFPRLCAACEEPLNRGEQQICIHCDYDLPYTDFHLHQTHPLAKQFWGRVPLTQAIALLYYSKGSRTQQLLHRLKYRQQPEIGLLLGQKMGEQVATAGQLPDFIIPVPLHPQRFKERGYNQSEYLAKGLSAVIAKPVLLHVLLRTAATGTQTKKDRFARVENMEQVFQVRSAREIKGKHLLLVDDVVTSGATLEACALALLAAGAASISITTAAYTK